MIISPQNTKKEDSPAPIEFAVFLLHKLAEEWKLPVPKVYEILNESKILDDYIIGHYKTLHTLGAEYLVNDITEFAREKGVFAQ